MCIFCKIINNEIPSYKVYEDDDVLAILDIAQVTKGHTLVMPKRHCDDILDCPEDDLKKVITVTQKLAKEIKGKLNAPGVNILSNCGEVAGQSVNHLHFHIIPRYSDQDAMVAKFLDSGIKAEDTAKELGL
ncbi:MAG: HIT family protein [Erysipelotrichaceae bacterium]|nr:HIT family protein [Erysipelotrichaceae bacterium]